MTFGQGPPDRLSFPALKLARRVPSNCHIQGRHYVNAGAPNASRRLPSLDYAPKDRTP